MKKIMVLAAGVLQTPIIKKGRELGYYVIAVDGNPEACGFEYADKAICANIVSEDEMLRIAKEENIDGVIHPCSEVSMAVMGRINDELKLHGVTKEQAIVATNKHLMRQAFEKNQAPSPKFYKVESSEDAWTCFCENFDTNAILKPSRNSGSRGISKIEKGISKSSFVQLYNIALHESRDKSVLIEQFVEGPEFSVEIIVWDGVVHVLAVTDKKTTGAPHFVELGHNQPSCFPDEIVELVKKAAVAGVKALGVNSCACHAEVKVQNGKAYLMEVGARMGGDFISTVLTELSTGIDMTAAAINCSLGIKPDLTPKHKPQGACIRYFTPPSGIVRGIYNEEACKKYNIESFQLYCKVGDFIPEITSSLSRSGHVIVTGDSAQDAIQDAENILSEIVFEIDK